MNKNHGDNLSSVFKDERKLAKWIEKSSLLAKWLEEEPPATIKKSKLVNFNIPTRRQKFLINYKLKFPEEEPPILAEIDFIYIHAINYPYKEEDHINKFFEHSGEFLPSAVEIKYFRKKKNGKINLPYYAGLDQSLSYLKFGFYHTRLWHFFDNETKKESDRYINHMVDLLEQTNLPLPIFYDVYLIEPGDEKREFDMHKLKQHYGSFNVNWFNPYYNNEKSAFLRHFILDEMGVSFLD